MKNTFSASAEHYYDFCDWSRRAGRRPITKEAFDHHMGNYFRKIQGQTKGILTQKELEARARQQMLSRRVS